MKEVEELVIIASELKSLGELIKVASSGNRQTVKVDSLFGIGTLLERMSNQLCTVAEEIDDKKNTE